MQTGINSNETKPCPSICVRYTVKALTDASCAGCKKAACDRCVAHIYEEKIHEGLRGPNHVFLWCNKFDDGVIEIRPLPSVQALLSSSIPVERLRDVICKIAHIAPPPVSVIKERDERVDI
jgi:hypothetical protein